MQKLGILGLSEAFARHGSRHNIFVNTIAPIASTAALARYLSTGQQNTPVLNLKPDYIAPFVVLLCSSQLNNPAHPVTGQLFELAGGWHASTRLRPANSLKRDKSSDQVQLSPHEPGSQTLRRIDKLKGFDFAVVDVQLEASDVILYSECAISSAFFMHTNPLQISPLVQSVLKLRYSMRTRAHFRLYLHLERYRTSVLQ